MDSFLFSNVWKASPRNPSDPEEPQIINSNEDTWELQEGW